MINRLRNLMTSVFRSLERAFDYSSHKGALILLTGYPTPDRIRRIGHTRLTSWLRNRHVRGSAEVAARATTAAKAQTVVLPGQERTASIVTELATAILSLDDRLKALDAQIEATFAQHPQAAIIRSMPGFGPFLGASLLVGAELLLRRWSPQQISRHWASRSITTTSTAGQTAPAGRLAGTIARRASSSRASPKKPSPVRGCVAATAARCYWPSRSSASARCQFSSWVPPSPDWEMW
jgi:transposase